MDWLEKKFDALRKDRIHGAAQLASSAIRILGAVCQRSKSADPEALILEVKQTALSLAKLRPSMAPICNWSFVFAHRLSQQAARVVSVRDAKRRGRLLAKDLLVLQREFIHHQVEAARASLGHCRSVVTLSYSSTVETILRHALPPGCKVIIAESRPLMEGRRLFRRLLGTEINLRILTDAQMGLVIPITDLVLVGADSILSDIAVVNKVGTYLAALVANTHGREFFVAADTYKINAAVNSSNCILESKSGKEVWPSQESSCENVYFDITPAQLVAGFLTEQGILDAAGMKKHVDRWRSLGEEFELI
jgi:translation initiation factor 2B subunit (eIF-2B alpha/beta/delta family)